MCGGWTSTQRRRARARRNAELAMSPGNTPPTGGRSLVIAALGRRRNHHTVREQFLIDLELLGLRPRRVHHTWRTFISMCLEDGTLAFASAANHERTRWIQPGTRPSGSGVGDATIDGRASVRLRSELVRNGAIRMFAALRARISGGASRIHWTAASRGFDSMALGRRVGLRLLSRRKEGIAPRAARRARASGTGDPASGGVRARRIKNPSWSAP